MLFYSGLCANKIGAYWISRHDLPELSQPSLIDLLNPLPRHAKNFTKRLECYNTDITEAAVTEDNGLRPLV